MSELYCWRAGFAGDIVFSTGAVRQIKKQGRFDRIYYGCWPAYRDLVAANPSVAEAVNCDAWSKDGIAKWEISHENYRKSHPGAMSLYWGEQLVRQARELGFINEVEADCRPDVYLHGEPPKMPDRMVLLTPWSNNGIGIRTWQMGRDGKPGSGWGRVIDLLGELGYNTVQTGLLSEPRLETDYDIRGKTRKLSDYMWIVARSDLLVTIDTLALHLAASRFYAPDGSLLRDGIPCVALCGPTGRPGVMPDDAPWIAEVSSLPKHPQCRCWESTPYAKFRCPYRVRDEVECMARITPEMVMIAIGEIRSI